MTGPSPRPPAKAGRRPGKLAVGLALGASVAGLAALALAQASGPRVVTITAERYEYSPEKVVLKRGEPVILELISHDRIHGFHVKGLNIRADVLPGHYARVPVTPTKAGVFPFSCDLFCGSGHPDMNGVITVIN